MFTPRVELTAAEQSVDFESLNQAIIAGRMRTEIAGTYYVKRIAFGLVSLGIAPKPAVDGLERALARELIRTANIGYRTARAEITLLRRVTDEPVSAYEVPDAGQFARTAAEGIARVRELVSQRARQAAILTAEAASRAFHAIADPDGLSVSAVATEAGKALHRIVLELVGETLNLGRTAGALSFTHPPTYSLRSEQLDKNTCKPCDTLHGEITEIGSREYWATLPPSGCLGGGRCRGVQVYADRIVDLRGPEPSEDELARIRDLARNR